MQAINIQLRNFAMVASGKHLVLAFNRNSTSKTFAWPYLQRVARYSNSSSNRSSSAIKNESGADPIRPRAAVAAVVPIPMNLGQPNLGPDEGPAKLLDAGLVQLLGSLDWRVTQLPPLHIDQRAAAATTTAVATTTADAVVAGGAVLKAKNAGSVGSCCERIFHHVKGVASSDDVFPLILGGDHCISIGSVSAIKAARKRAGVVWVDAHADINTPATSSSGNMHGMPLAFLLGLVQQQQQQQQQLSLPAFEWFSPCLLPSELVYIGLRDLDAAEKAAIRQLGIKAFTMHDVDRLGIGKVMEQALDHFFPSSSSFSSSIAATATARALGERCTELHLSFDIDAIDPFFAPHTGTAVTGGLTFREGNFICEELAASGRLTSMELVEVDPAQHAGLESGRTVDMALTLIGSAMGKKIL